MNRSSPVLAILVEFELVKTSLSLCGLVSAGLVWFDLVQAGLVQFDLVEPVWSDLSQTKPV